jgi:hypothetical protein
MYNMFLSYINQMRFPQLLSVALAWSVFCPTAMIGAFYCNLRPLSHPSSSFASNIYGGKLMLVSSPKKECRLSRSMKRFALSASIGSASIEPEETVRNRNIHDDDTKTNRRLVWNRLLECFQGDFDNYRQVVEDRQKNLLPKEGGGHEHFHCTLIPLNDTSRLAAFYFDGNPNRIFRFRYYEFVNGMRQKSDFDVVEMRLCTLNPTLETILRANAHDPLSWPSIFEEFQPPSIEEPKLNLLPKCEITWSLEKDPVQHSYAIDIPEIGDDENADRSDDGETYDRFLETSRSLHAVMVHGQAIVDSTIVPGMKIRILDQLSLYDDVFYINDRGFDPVSGAFIYGNQRGVPYRLERVTSLSGTPSSSSPSTSSSAKFQQQDDIILRQSTSNDIQRHVVDPDLKWTLGPRWRTADEYDIRLQAIGGPSAGISKRDFTQSRANNDKKS